MRQNKGNGALPELEQIRNYDFEVACGTKKASQYPEEYIINERYLGVLKDQEDYNCCVGCVMSSLAEIFELIEQYGPLEALEEKDWNKIFSDRENIEFSEFWAYGALRTEDYDCEGMYSSDAVKNWNEKGILPKKYFNIVAEAPKILEEVHKFPELYEKAINYRTKSYLSLNYALQEKKDQCIKEALMKYKHGLLGVSNKHFGGSHCIMVVGWNDKKNTYKIKNSWGSDWGDEHGVGEIPKGHLNEVFLILDKELTLPFTDVNKENWYYKPIKNMYFSNIMKGTSEKTFEPNRNITRAEISALINRIVKLVEERIQLLIKLAKEQNLISRDYNMPKLLSNIKAIPFTDVKQDAWYYEDIKAIYNLDLIKGITEDIFAPEDNLNRAELATLCVRLRNMIIDKFNELLKYINKSLTADNIIAHKEFIDVSSNAWYFDEVNLACDLGFMQGTSETTFEPERYTIRAEVATILNRLTKYIDDKGNETRSLLY